LGDKQLASVRLGISSNVSTQLQNATNAWIKKGYKVIERVNIGPYGAGVGHDEFTGDSMQSYRYVLLWLSTKNPEHATNAANILQQWSYKCVSFQGLNAPLESAWGSTALIRSAELLKYTWSGWTPDLEKKINNFLTNIIVPNLKGRYLEISLWYSNWILVILEALIQIAIFRNSVIDFQWAVSEYRRLCPLTFTKPFTGQNTETTRDQIHSQFQLASHIQIAEMCWHQGVKDLYTPGLATSMEYIAGILIGEKPKDLPATYVFQQPWFLPSAWEIGYNHYVNRTKTIQLPKSLKILSSRRPESMSFNWGPGWTHYNTA